MRGSTGAGGHGRKGAEAKRRQGTDVRVAVREEYRKYPTPDTETNTNTVTSFARG